MNLRTLGLLGIMGALLTAHHDMSHVCHPLKDTWT
jgi:hypothetical protein